MPIEMVFAQWRRNVTKNSLDNEDVLVYKISKACEKITA